MGDEITLYYYDRINTSYKNGKYYFPGGLNAVMRNGKWGYIDKSGMEVISPVFEEAGGFYDEYALVKLNGRYLLIDTDGYEVISLVRKS